MVFTDMEKWAEIRRLVKVEERSKRSVCREFNIHWDTLVKILEHTEPPGYPPGSPAGGLKIILTWAPYIGYSTRHRKPRKLSLSQPSLWQTKRTISL